MVVVVGGIPHYNGNWQKANNAYKSLSCEGGQPGRQKLGKTKRGDKIRLKAQLK